MTRKLSRTPPVTADRLVRGWTGPGGTRLRLARPGDAAAVGELLALADIRLYPALKQVIDDGTVASTLLLGLRHGPADMLRPLVIAAHTGDPDEALSGLLLVVVAEGPNGRLHAVLLAGPPGNVIYDAYTGGVRLEQALLGAAKVAKIQCLAVAEHARGHGLGETLLRRVVRTYLQLDFLLIYGQFSAESGLAAYYTRQGFTVLPEGQDIDLSRTSMNVIIRHDPSERLFTRWR